MPFLAPIAAGIAAFAATAVGGFLINLAISFVIGRIVQNRMKKKMEAMQRANRPSVMVNTASNNEAIPVAYGRTRIGGNRLYTESTDGAGNTNINTHLNMIFSICEGEVTSIKQVWFDNKIVWDADNGGTIDGNNKLGGFISEFAPALNDSATKVVFYNGTDSQTADSELSTSIGSQWTSNHRLRGIVYCGMVLKANSEVYKGGLPLMTFVIEGKPVLDVSQLPSQVNASATYDMNPVDVLYDYMINTRYGKGLDHNASGVYTPGLHIDYESFATARGQVSSLFKLNGVVDTNVPLFDNVGEILESMNGVLIFQNGKYTLKIKRQNETPALVFTDTKILSPVSVTMPAKAAKFNKVLADYRNKVSGTDYNDDIAIVENATYLSEDNGTELEGRIRLDLIDDTTLINTMATYTMNESRYQQKINFDAAHTVLKIQCGEIVGMNLPEFGWGTDDGYPNGKLFRVDSMSMNPDNTISIEATEYESSIQLV